MNPATRQPPPFGAANRSESHRNAHAELIKRQRNTVLSMFDGCAHANTFNHARRAHQEATGATSAPLRVLSSRCGAMMKHFQNLNHNRFICRFDWLFMVVRLTVGLVDNLRSNEASHPASV